HDNDAGVICSGFVRLVGDNGPCSGRVEVRPGEEWTPVSDGNFTLPTAQVICAELGCGKAVSVLGHELFRESDGLVWAEEFRCEGEERKLWWCPRVPCPGGSCHHSGAAQVICSAYSEVRLMTNCSSQCEGQVEINISGRWRALCASHWTLANANVVCRQFGCGVAISTPRGPHLVERGDQISTVRFHCSGAESFLWSCPMTALGGPDCSHGNTASVVCSGNQTQVLRQCNDSVSEPAGSAASEESAPYCLDSRQLRLEEAYISCAGRRPKSCPGAAPCTDREKLRLRGGDSECLGRVESDCKHEEDAGVRCSGARTTLPPAIAGTRPPSNPLPGIFSLPWVLCLILGALLFLVLIILVTQLLRWRAERRAFSSYEDALAEAEYEELDYLVTQKEGLLDIPGYLSDGEDDEDSRSAPDQRTDAPGEGYDDAEKVPVPGAPPASQVREEEVPPEKEDGMRSQTGSSLFIFGEEADPAEGEESPWLLQGDKGDPGYDDIDVPQEHPQ
ncbi:hypothetical protein CapIbe_024168, partial [Capra ibex]